MTKGLTQPVVKSLRRVVKVVESRPFDRDASIPVT